MSLRLALVMFRPLLVQVTAVIALVAVLLAIGVLLASLWSGLSVEAARAFLRTMEPHAVVFLVLMLAVALARWVLAIANVRRKLARLNLTLEEFAHLSDSDQRRILNADG